MHVPYRTLVLLAIVAVAPSFAGAGRAPRKLKVEILGFDGCPTSKSARDLVRNVARARGTAVEIRMVDVPDGRAAERLRFFGSPTIRIEGQDIERKMRNVRHFGLACRLYDHPGGPTGLPPRAMVAAAFREALAQRRAKAKQ